MRISTQYHNCLQVHTVSFLHYCSQANDPGLIFEASEDLCSLPEIKLDQINLFLPKVKYMAFMAVRRYTWISIQSIEHKFWTEMNNFSEFIAHLSLLDFLR